MSVEYISLSSDGNCQDVSNTNTGEFSGALTGIWSGYDGYRSSDEIYLMSLENFQATTNEFDKVVMSPIYESLKELGELSLTQDAALNLLLWMAWEVSTPTYTFEMSGDPIAIFARQYLLPSLSRCVENCNLNLIYASYHIYVSVAQAFATSPM